MRGPLFAVFCILFASCVTAASHGFVDTETTPKESQPLQAPGIARIPQEVLENHNISRYIVFGKGHSSTLDGLGQTISSVDSQNGFFSIVVLQDQTASYLAARGYSVMRDLPLEFDQKQEQFSAMDQIRRFTGADRSYIYHNYTGSGIRIAIVDTGVDFANPDMQGALARDSQNRPVMLDADGQGIVLTRATFIANIDKNGIVHNATKQFVEEKNRTLSKNATSTVYVTKDGVFLHLSRGGGTNIPTYNSFFPQSGPSPTFNATISDNYKIGKSNRDYIKSASGVYHFGMLYQGSVSGPFASVQVAPVLVVDSETAGIYDTIIPDMSTSWKDYTRFHLPRGQSPNYDFDFTDEARIRLGGGNEFLLYDSNKDGKPDYSAGTVGASVLDIYGVISQNKSAVDKALKATNGTALAGLDPSGNYFGVMSDFVGHGTSSAASISSSGESRYDIYNNTKKYTLPGVATGAKIVPVKALWFGDTLYGWLWAAGFDNHNSTWGFSGKPRADIISNSWGISTFPSLNTVPGVDILSLVSSALSTPNSLDERYPGVLMVSSSGNAGHGYGTLGLPNASPYGMTVGASTNNVYVGYGSFAGQPRFGNTTSHANHIVDFSSRGPSIIGDPKPDLVGTGAYGFVPANPIKQNPKSKAEPFAMFGGTSMAAPIAAGSAAILMEGLQKNNIQYTPFDIKNILMSTATDLSNDPMSQGSGLVNSFAASQFADGKGGVFSVHNDASYHNIKKILDGPMQKLNSTVLGLERLELPERPQGQTGWFGGRLEPGQKSHATFTIENPGDAPILVRITPRQLGLIEEASHDSATKFNLTDSLYNRTGVYRPDYVKLTDVKSHDALPSFFENRTVPESSLMILSLNFAFSDFMNNTEKMYASDTKIASLYLYDWNDKNKDDSVSSDELSLVNRAGSWGTVQEMRVSEPSSKFEHTPLVGVYAVPTRHSYWAGDTKMNATKMDYTLTASYYAKKDWEQIWLDSSIMQVGPKSSEKITATITVPQDARPGVYQGFLEFASSNHTANAPVSFSVVSPVDSKNTVKIIPGAEGDIMYGNGYVKGAFDMTNRYNAGDWRHYHFDIKDSAINAASIDVSWKNGETNFSAFVIDPQGRIVQSNVPSGAFGNFLDWPTSDWLGTTVFSEGGGFFPVKNKDATSTVLFAPINQTGTYTLLLHSTLFSGKSATEPFTVLAQFSSLSADSRAPQILYEIPQFVSGPLKEAQVVDESDTVTRYYLDGSEITASDLGGIPDGAHTLRVESTDAAGNTSQKIFEFVMDSAPPLIKVISPQNNTAISGIPLLEYEVIDENPMQATAVLPDGTVLAGTRVELDPAKLGSGPHTVTILAEDAAKNRARSVIVFEIAPEARAEQPAPPAEPPQEARQIDQTAIYLGLGGAVAIGAISIVIFGSRARQKRPRRYVT